MNLTVTNYNINNYHVPARKTTPTFKAHKDFYHLNRLYEVTRSIYFRRGSKYNMPSPKYIDIVKTFSKILYNNPDIIIKMLIAGIGNSQEVFSYMTTIKQILNQKDITDIVDLNIVDLQSKPSDKKLKIDSFFDRAYKPDKFAPDSFIMDTTKYGQESGLKYRVKDDIYELVRKSYNDPQKSKWDTRIQEAIKTYEDESFKVISSNNTLGYIDTLDTIIETVQHMCRCLEKGGFLILDPEVNYLSIADLYGKMEYYCDGIYIKL